MNQTTKKANLKRKPFSRLRFLNSIRADLHIVKICFASVFQIAQGEKFMSNQNGHSEARVTPRLKGIMGGIKYFEWIVQEYEIMVLKVL